MFDLRKDLIDKELSYLSKKMTFKRFRPSNRFVSWLFRHYFVDEFTIHWYDEEKDDGSYIEDRMTFNNWIDVYGSGIDHFTQKLTDDLARFYLDFARKSHLGKKKERFYFAQHGDYLYIYYYGRDYLYHDYWWVLSKKPDKRNH